MSDDETVDISRISFRSAVFPTDEDMRLWRSLSPQEQRAVIMCDVEEGLRGPAAKRAGKDEIVAEALAETTRVP